MRALLLAAAVLCTMAAPAAATEWIYCSDATGQVEIGMLANFGLFSFSRGTLRVGSDFWSTQPDAEQEPAKSMSGLESYADDHQLYVKFSDDQMSAVLADLRVVIVTEADVTAQGGVLDVPGKGVWVVSCEGP